MKCKLAILLIFLATSFFADDTINLNNIKEYKITKNKLHYIIQAKTKKVDFKKLKKFMFFNKAKIASEYTHYLDGQFKTKHLKINFKKAYFLEGNFVMSDITGSYKKKPFKAKKAIYKKSILLLNSVFIKINNIKYKKIRYSITLN